MRVEINKTQQKILLSIMMITHEREDSKEYYINANLIAKKSGLSWRTVKHYLKKGIIL